MAVEKWMDLNGKVVIVTGGSQGIGEHVVQNLRANNAFVVVADLRINENFIEDKGIVFVKCVFHVDLPVLSTFSDNIKNLMLKIW